MCASPLRLLRAGPPPPKVALLPDALFFTRAVPVTKGALPAEAATQIELALEGLSPFPLTQLYYGWFWLPGAEQALVFAAYRRRFTSEQTSLWADAELVLPAFGALFGAEVEAGTTIVLNAPESLTAVHWDNAQVPSQVVVRAIDPEWTDDERGKLRDDVLRAIGGSRKVLELDSPLEADSSLSDREIVFRDGAFVSRLPATIAAAIDVRDKAELAALRNARQRDVVMWRVTLGFAAALVLLAVGEFALMGGKAWQRVRDGLYRGQKAQVDRIERTHELTSRIEDLKTKRLLPLEMVSQIVGEGVIPPDIIFTRAVAETSRGLYTLIVEGKTENNALVTAYETAVSNLPSVQKATVQFQSVVGTRATFVLTVTFKPEALKPTGIPVASTP